MRKKIQLIIFAFAFLIFVPKDAGASGPDYPIGELGNCRDKQECSLYCQIPSNSPACWSYGKYLLSSPETPSVLGKEAVNIAYPIPELGNCSSGEDCFVFCQQKENQKACRLFGKSRKLTDEDEETPPPPEVLEAAKNELGCTDKETCRDFCEEEENREKCASFARKYNLFKLRPAAVGHLSEEIMAKARAEFDCNSKESCSRFCSQKENRERCFLFAERNGLLKEKEENEPEFKKKTVGAAKNELGCADREQCRDFCEEEENREKCASFARKYNLYPAPDASLLNGDPPFKNAGFSKKGFQEIMSSGGQNPSGKSFLPGPGGCATEKECRDYCQKHETECPGFGIGQPANNNLPPQTDINLERAFTEQNEMMIMEKERNTNREGDFLGPAGCKTEKECKDYCQKHPGVCPGFPETDFSKPSLKQNPAPGSSFSPQKQLDKPARPSSKPE